MTARLLATWRRSPYGWILLAALALRLAGLAWGLPASDGWDDDGVAPRNFLVGVVQTYQPGGFFAYPPLHMLILMLLTLPGSVLAILQAPSLTPHDVIQTFIQVPYMTGFAVVARSVSVIMSLATIYLIGRMTELAAGRRAGLFAAAACALNAILTYYSQVSNLDVPYMFWAVLSIFLWMRLIAEHDVTRIRGACLCAAAAVATKDQAYAVFLFSIPAALGLWFALDRWPRAHARGIAARIAAWSLAALLGLLAIDGALTNPEGFLRRVAFLAGPASLDYAQYGAGPRGWLALMTDACAGFSRAWPVEVAALAAFGFCLQFANWFRSAASAGADGSSRAARSVALALPLLAAMSFTLAFNLVALRSENRFLLPQSVFLAVPIGLGAEYLTRCAGRPVAAWAGKALAGLLALMALRLSLSIDAAMIDDPRYDAERWMAQHVRPGETIEALGLNAFLPRFPPAAIVTRLDRKPLAGRNPLPGVQEIEAPFEAVERRQPSFIVVNAFWLRNYLAGEATAADDGRIVQPVRQRVLADVAARAYFAALTNGGLGYHVSHLSQYRPGLWAKPDGYESLGQTIYILQR